MGICYIAAPAGFRFIPGILNAEDPKASQRDQLMNQAGEIIHLQKIVQDYLRTTKRQQKRTVCSAAETANHNVTIYHHQAPNTDAQFLLYIPNNNGAYPAQKPAELIKGLTQQLKHFPPNNSFKGSLFHVNSPELSPERRARLIEKSAEQRDNRRHIGDSPAAT